MGFQFRSIYSDKSILDEDKIQYSLQSIFPNSKALGLVESFPATPGNYSKAIHQLTERLGYEDTCLDFCP